jgi:restriction endonuclease S subunit
MGQTVWSGLAHIYNCKGIGIYTPQYQKRIIKILLLLDKASSSLAARELCKIDEKIKCALKGMCPYALRR